MLFHIGHTANRYCSEKNKKTYSKTYPKREHFSSSPYHEPQANARRPAAQNYSTPRHMGRGLAGHPRRVKLGTGDNTTRLYTSIRSMTPTIWQRVLHIDSAQQSSHPACQSDEFAGKRSRGTAFPSSERVKLLQPLLPRPQERWWSKTHSRSQTSESRPYNYINADPLSNMPRHIWAVPGSPHFYEVHGCGSFPAETDGNTHPELPRWLAHFGTVGGWASISQNCAISNA